MKRKINDPESKIDYLEPHTLKKARKIMERLIKDNDKWVNPFAKTIRDPRHFNEHGFNTEFYSHEESN